MQESFRILSSSGDYQVVAGTELLENVITRNPQAIFIVDERLADVLPNSVTRRILIEANEENKSLEKMPRVLLRMRELGANRSSHLVAIGGGVIQDITTFVAAIYMRGVPWTYMPTTLLGMADSCIGGKSSINMAGYKNLVGNFYPPKDVLIDMAFINTLNADQVVGGLYEAAKICFARGYEEFLLYLEESPKYPMNTDNAQRVIVRALKTKKWFIETDEFDQKERLLLNFGHTFGHAIEAGTNFGISHGLAVGVGMIIAAEYAKITGVLTDKGLACTEHLAEHVKSLMGKGLSLVMESPPSINLNVVMEKFNHDKKHQIDNYRIVIPTGDGGLELVAISKQDNERSRIKSAYINGLHEIGYPGF